MLQQRHVGSEITAGQVGALGRPALACKYRRPHWVPKDHDEALTVSLLDVRRCCCAPPWRRTSGAASHCRQCLPMSALQGGATGGCPTLWQARRFSSIHAPVPPQGLRDAMHDCKECSPGGTSSYLLHVHLQMCLQLWMNAACSTGALSGEGLQPAGQKLALSGSKRLLDWRGGCCCCTSRPLPQKLQGMLLLPPLA